MNARLVIALGVSLILQQRPAFRSGVDLVSVDVSVTHGLTPVKGLKAENFQLTDNGIPQDVQSVSLDNRPISVMLVLDTSRSMGAADVKPTRLAAAQAHRRGVEFVSIVGMVS